MGLEIQPLILHGLAAGGVLLFGFFAVVGFGTVMWAMLRRRRRCPPPRREDHQGER